MELAGHWPPQHACTSNHSAHTCSRACAHEKGEEKAREREGSGRSKKGKKRYRKESGSEQQLLGTTKM